MQSSWKMATTLRGMLISSALFALACGGDKGATSSSASASAAASSSESTPSASGESGAASAPASAPSAVAPKPADPVASGQPAVAQAPGEVDVDQLFKEEPDGSTDLLEVDPNKVSERAPKLTGLKIAQPAKDKAEWLPLVNLEILNPGWAKQKNGDVGVLYSDKLHTGVAFATYEAKANGGQRVDQLTKALGWTQIRWVKKPTALRLGEDSSVPATLFFGRAKSAKGDPIKVFFALMKTGKPVNVVAVGGARESSPPEAFKTALGIVALVKRKG